MLQGLRKSKALTQIEQHFLDMEWLSPLEPETFVDAASLYRLLRSKGVTIRSTTDCIIAKLAAENDVLILSKDRDLRLIIESGLLDVRALPIA